MARKFYIESDKDYKKGEDLVIVGEEFNHIKNVMRYGIGAELSVINGTGYNYICEITAIRKNDLILKVKEVKECDSDPKSEVTVYQALVKGEKLELITQKLTELGVTRFVPFHSEFCQVKPNTTRIDRLEKISIEALKQCGRSKKMEISKVISFNSMLEELKKHEEVVFAYEGATPSLCLEKFKTKRNIAIIVGSEGGFSPKEVTTLSALKNIQTISLGKRILRAETAAISLSTLILFSLGELSL